MKIAAMRLKYVLDKLRREADLQRVDFFMLMLNLKLGFAKGDGIQAWPGVYLEDETLYSNRMGGKNPSGDRKFNNHFERWKFPVNQGMSWVSFILVGFRKNAIFGL